MVVKCPKCGIDNKDDVNFCSKCGASLKNSNVIKTNSSSDVISRIKGMNRNTKIIGLVLIVFIVAAIALVFFSSSYTTEVNGVTFNIPNDYEKIDYYSDTVYGFDLRGALFENNYDDSILIIVGECRDGITFTSSDLKLFAETYNSPIKKNINGIEGYTCIDYLDGEKYYYFVYLKDNNLVQVAASDSSIIDKVVR